MLVKCPKCGSDKVYASALYMGWKCENPECGVIFQIDEANVEKSASEKKAKSTKTKSSEKKETQLVMKVGDKDNAGNTLVFRDQINGVVHDIWESKSKRKYTVGIPKTDQSGKVIGRYNDYDAAFECIRNLGFTGKQA